MSGALRYRPVRCAVPGAVGWLVILSMLAGSAALVALVAAPIVAALVP